MVNSACPNLIFVYRPFKLRLSRLSGLNLSSLVSINHNYIHSSVWHSVYFACMLSYLIFNIPSVCPSVRLSVCPSVCLSAGPSVMHYQCLLFNLSVTLMSDCVCYQDDLNIYLSIGLALKTTFVSTDISFGLVWGFEPSFITFFWPSRHNFLTM